MREGLVLEEFFKVLGAAFGSILRWLLYMSALRHCLFLEDSDTLKVLTLCWLICR